MKSILIYLLFIPLLGEGQVITGKWKTIDDETNKVRSLVEIFDKDGKIFGRVVKIFSEPEEDPDPVCNACPEGDDRFNKKVIGMVILRNMTRTGESYSGGDILDPKIGKIYRCKVWLEKDDLKVRGYWGPFYRTQTWKRAN